ncbi:endonuclease/exonuclease/phosphatase family protein [Formosa sp. 4Alg 33]|uniref:endonuclease/exonuclease/phosphatase family protein n=1 Tax=Formosa sp. 4Alg 33 TaxID=3382189 RepID=UPI003D9C2241
MSKKKEIKKVVMLIIFLSSIYLANGQSNGSIKIISANVRVALKEDSLKGLGWNDRKKNVFKVIRNQNPDIICLQEVIKVQNEDFKNAFKTFYAIGFEGPEMDPYTDGGYYKIAKNPILYNKSKFKLISAGQYWLSDTPHLAGSVAWGSSRARNVNWLRLEEKSSGKQFRILNTHLDHKSSIAKLKQTQMIIEETNQYQDEFIQILAGDFNSDQESLVVKSIINYWKDSYGELYSHNDPGFTVHGFLGENAKTTSGKVDFIFIKGDVVSRKAKVIKDKIAGIYPSDHYFVTADLEFK